MNNNVCSSNMHANGDSTLNALEWLPVRTEWECSDTSHEEEEDEQMKTTSGSA